MSQEESELRQTAWLFTRQDSSVRLEAQGTVLLVQGPGSDGARHEFADAEELTAYRDGLERDLIARGFRLQAVAERRSQPDRRQAPRGDRPDRRR